MSIASIQRKFTNVKQVEQYAYESQRNLLILQDKILDVTSFAEHHPGGGLLLKNKNIKDIGEDMKFHHPLSIEMANTMAIGSFKKDISRMISPDRPLLKQIWDLNNEQYMHVVYSPHWLFVPSPKMFQSDFIDSFSHCKWFLVPLMPILVVIYLFFQINSWDNFNLNKVISVSAIGFLFFTFVQYFLHRFIFHSQKYLPDSRIARYVHFFAHGIHHMLPNDPDRLVLPAPMYCVIFSLGYFTVGKVVTFDDAILSAFFWTFFQIGYVTYDLCHYALHHIDTSKTKRGYFHDLQRYHNQHHFGGQQAGFGVSSKLWDIILRTGYKNHKRL